MPSATEHHSTKTTKCLLIGDSGAGKTGAIASLVCAGYNIRMLDFDNGADALIALLTDPASPYAQYIKQKGINLNEAFNYLTINEEMRKDVRESREVPKSAKGWPKTISMLEDWADDTIRFDGIDSWGEKDVLVFDTLGTLSFLAYFYVQSLNGRLGARMEGFDYQRDIGGAQNLLEGLLQKLYSIYVKCNVIIISHITKVDESRGIAAMPSRDPNVATLELKGYPSAIGRALSPRIGKYFNNVLYAKESGVGGNVRHEIYTRVTDGISVKTSRPWALEQRYSNATALAEIFATLRGEPKPTDLIAALSPKSQAPARPIRA